MAVDIFAKLGDIKGESQDDKHKDEIEVLSYSWGVTDRGSIDPGPGGGGGSGGGKAAFHDLVITHHLDKASPQLFQACATGQHLKEATVTQRKAGKGQQEFLIIKMNDVIITGVTHGGTTDALPTESVSVVFSKVDLEYRPTKADGSLDAGVHFKFDLKVGK
jgi:type VI secretion system secreted protein Hcp